MSAITYPTARPSRDVLAESDLDHVVCECDENLALCGLDVSEYDWSDGEDPVDCVVCADLEDLLCARCGA